MTENFGRADCWAETYKYRGLGRSMMFVFEHHKKGIPQKGKPRNHPIEKIKDNLNILCIGVEEL
jgi:hypothetical protein